MKLQIVRPHRIRKREARLSFAKAGAIRFSAAAMKAIGAARKFDFLQDQENPDSWYLRFDPEGSLTLREVKQMGQANSVSIYHRIAQSTRNDHGKTFSAKLGRPIDHDGTALYPLLIKMGDKTYPNP